MKWLKSLIPKPLPCITVAEYAVWRESQTEHLLLDVRNPGEIAGGAIAGHVNIPLGELPERLSEIEAWKDRKVVCMCRSGMRSAGAARMLMKHGFTDVRNLAGGYLAWPAG